MDSTYSELQLDALRELANIGSGTAATSLSAMLGRPVDIDIPAAQALPVIDAVEAAGSADDYVTAVNVEVFGGIEGTALLVCHEQVAAVLVGLLGVEPGTDIAASALCEIGNVLVSSYVGALASMTGLELEPRPPQLVEDMLAAVLASVLLEAGEGNIVLQLESVLAVDGDSCPLAFLFIPTPEGVVEMLSRLGLS